MLEYLQQRKAQILELIAIDRLIGAEPYDNVARLREIERIEKILRKEGLMAYK